MQKPLGSILERVKRECTAEWESAFLRGVTDIPTLVTIVRAFAVKRRFNVRGLIIYHHVQDEQGKCTNVVRF